MPKSSGWVPAFHLSDYLVYQSLGFLGRRGIPRSLRELNNRRDGRPVLHTDWRHPSDFTTRLVEAGFRANIAGGRVGRGTRLPPQFGQMPCSRFSAQVAQKVHS